MTWLLRHWLGIAVLAMFVLALLFMFHPWATVPNVYAVCFVFFAGVWVLRAFVRFLGRAWHHGQK